MHEKDKAMTKRVHGEAALQRRFRAAERRQRMNEAAAAAAERNRAVSRGTWLYEQRTEPACQECGGSRHEEGLPG